MKFTKQYFIDKFSEIPEDKIGIKKIENCCALYHCGVNQVYDMTEEAVALSNLLFPIAIMINPQFTNPNYASNVYAINDDDSGVLGDTPKKRILKALDLI